MPPLDIRLFLKFPLLPPITATGEASTSSRGGKLKTKKSQAGITMIEVLVSAIIMAIGLLGMATLQVKSMRSNYEAQLFSLATAQANDMSDRMRANVAGITAGYYDNMIPGAPTQAQIDSLTCSGCSTLQVAMRDYREWALANSALLPSGLGFVSKVGSVYRITVMFDSKKTGASGTNCSGNTSVDLTCVRLDVEI